MSETLSVLVIPVEGPLETHELGDDSLGKLQELVGGCIEAVPIPDFVNGAYSATGLFMGDYIPGPFVLAGFNPETGDNAVLPKTVERRARKIEREAGS